MRTLVNTINLSDGTSHYKFTVGQMVIKKLNGGAYIPVIIKRIEMVSKDEPYWIDSVSIEDEITYSAPHTEYQTVDDLVDYLKMQQVSNIMERMIKLGKEKGTPSDSVIPYIEQSGRAGTLTPRTGRMQEQMWGIGAIGTSDAIIGSIVPGTPYMSVVKAEEMQITVLKNRFEGNGEDVE